MIPAAIPAPQAVAETINSHCPPGLSVAPVGTTIALYRGASKTAFASFAYTGPDSVLGIVVATWRIALAEHSQPVTNITNVSNSLAAADIEEMKARSDALQILGWPGGPVEPTSWARSYLNIEAMTLSEAREAAEKAEKLQAEASVELARQRDRTRALLDALCKLGYHPDMDLDEWAEARVKQRDATESSVRALESEVAAMRAEIDEMLPAGSHDLDAVRKVLLAAKGFDNSTRSTAQLAEDVAARLSATGDELERPRDRAAKANADIGVITQGYFAAGFGPSPATPGGIAGALDKARRRGDALRTLGWDGIVDPETWARHCPTESETLAQVRGALLEALGLAKQGTGRPIIELLAELVEARDKARHYAERAFPGALGPVAQRLIDNPSMQNIGKTATIGVRIVMDPKDGVDVARALSTPLTATPEKAAGFTIGSKETVGPRWTGITWMSSKGRAKTCRIEGITFSVSDLAPAGLAPTVIKVPTSPWNLPAKLVRRIHAGEKLSFHVGGGKVITGCVAKVDASAISSMLLYVAT